jgi:repressor LexA
MPVVSDAVRHVYDTLWRLSLGGESPSVRELATAAKRSASTVSAHLATLRRVGWVARRGRTSRSLRIVGGPHMVDRALLDLSEHAVAAGRPSPAATIDDALPQAGLHPEVEGSVFAIRARGDSMIGRAIVDGDTLVVRAQNHARHGDLVVAVVPDGTDLGGATVKVYDIGRGRPRLLAANPAYGPIESDELRIVGKVLGVWRRVAS